MPLPLDALRLRAMYFVAFCVLLPSSGCASPGGDPLPSRNQTSAKRSIVGFVNKATPFEKK